MNDIHPTAVIGPDVELGTGVHLSPYVVVLGRTRIGDGVWIGPHSTLGTPAEMRSTRPPEESTVAGLSVDVGAGTVIREFVTVHQGTKATTTIGRECYLMSRCHVPHDGVLGDSVTVSCSAQIGGHSWIGDGANVGLGAVLHQFSVVGAFAMIGMQAAVTKPVPPFSMVMGVPARVTGANRVALDRLGLSAEEQASWGERLAAGEVVGRDGPDALRNHVVAYDGVLAEQRQHRAR